MATDRLENAAYKNIPSGYKIVRSGKFISGDLCWDWCGKVFRRHDDRANWDQEPLTDIEDAVMVVRPSRTTTFDYGREDREDSLSRELPLESKEKQSQFELFGW